MSGPEVRMNVELLNNHLDRTRVSNLEPPVTERSVLEELFNLLEDYAPSWYTEQHHNRAIAALLGRER